MKPDELTRLLSKAESHLQAGRNKVAISAYRDVIRRFPNSTEAHFQLAVLLHDQGDLDGAVRHFRLLLKQSPKLAEVHFNLGTILASLKRRQEAADAFRRAIELQPGMAVAHNNLGVALRDLGELELAVESFEAAISLAPRNVAALINLGTTLTKLRRVERAIEVCQLARDVNPNLAETHLAFGLALELSGRQAEAVQAIDEAVKRKPESREWQYHVAAVRGRGGPAIAPPEYVASLFDAYAAKFDEHLRGKLQYQTPEHIQKAVLSVSPELKSVVLDLGCGTGLCGALFRPTAGRLVGIDLSAEMIRVAADRRIYDDLHVSDIVQYLSSRSDEFDLVLAADVFVYVGDLQDTFQLVSSSLRSKGIFAFSVEAADDPTTEAMETVSLTDGYHLGTTRRYSHSREYVRRTAIASGFAERVCEYATLRAQAGVDVGGWIFVLQRKH